MVNIKIPDDLKSHVPPNLWGKVLNATPVVMTVIATMLAGLSSSEMTRAQYERSLATQLQSKAGDQWGFFQAKRLRGAMQAETLDLLASTVEIRPLDEASLTGWWKSPPDLPENIVEAARLLVAGELPPIPVATTTNPKVQAALDAIARDAPQADLEKALAAASVPAVAAELKSAQDRSRAFDEAVAPITKAFEWLAGYVDARRDEHGAALRRDFTAARLRLGVKRYEAEAHLNQAIANLYELQVRQSNLSAERHVSRSQRFFYGMLAAQAGVILATFAIAARKRNFLWSIAAAAGVAALSFAAYVYVFL